MSALYIDAIWLATAFFSGLIMRRLGLPTLLGFLASGFLLHSFGAINGALSSVLGSLSDLGITLLLFTIGLKIKFKTLIQKEILVTASSHMLLTTLAFSGLLFLLSFSSIRIFSNLSIWSALSIGFALSFSSTVFVIKSLEDRGELTSSHGRMAIGILIIQDIFAVIFLTATNDIVPSLWALGLPLYLYLIRFILNPLLSRTGHEELLTIFGFFAPLIAGALVFDFVNIKYDLGALIIGMLLVNHAKADELYERMLKFKDFFLIAFFINIGLSESPTLTTLYVAIGLLITVFFKGFLFNYIMSFFKLRARTNFLTSLSLTNFSEFGLIVGAVGIKVGLVTEEWVVILAILMSFSFLVAAPLNAKSYELFDYFKTFLTKFNKTPKDIDCQPAITSSIQYLVIGIGSFGKPALQRFVDEYGNNVLAIDYNNEKIEALKSDGFNANWGDTTDRDFWEEGNFENVKLIVLTMSDYASTYNTLKQINRIKNRPFKVAAVCHYADEKKKLTHLNVDYVYYYKTDLGIDFAEHALEQITQKN